MLAILIWVWFLILLCVTLIPAILISSIFSITYKKIGNGKKVIIYSTICAPVITLIYFLIAFHQKAVWADYLFFPFFAFCCTPLIAALRLKRIKTLQEKSPPQKGNGINDALYFVLISTLLGFIYFIRFGFSSPFGQLHFFK